MIQMNLTKQKDIRPQMVEKRMSFCLLRKPSKKNA